MTPRARPVEIARSLAAGRLSAHDEGGIIACDGMNIDTMQQEPHSPKARLSLLFTVEPVSKPKVRSAIEKINAFEYMVEPMLLLRIMWGTGVLGLAGVLRRKPEQQRARRDHYCYAKSSSGWGKPYTQTVNLWRHSLKCAALSPPEIATRRESPADLRCYGVQCDARSRSGR